MTTNVLNKNKKNFDEFYGRYYKKQFESFSNRKKKRAQERKDYLLAILKDQFNHAIQNSESIEAVLDNKKDLFQTSNEFKDSLKFEVGRVNQNERDIYDKDNTIINISEFFGRNNPVYSLKDYNNLFAKFSELSDLKKSADVAMNKNVLDWKSVDYYQDNIGSVKSIVEFFFNMMNCYNSTIISRNGVDREVVANGDWYVSLPEEWRATGGLLDKMFSSNQNANLKKLKEYGIPFTGVVAKMIYKDAATGWTLSQDAQQNPSETLRVVGKCGFTQIGVNQLNNNDSENAWKAGATFSPFFSPKNYIANCAIVNLNGTSQTIPQANYGATLPQPNPTIDGAGGIPRYYGVGVANTNMLLVNNSISSISAVCSNRYRLLYDIVYSDPALTRPFNESQQIFIPNYHQQSAVSIDQTVKDVVGGYVSVFGALPLLATQNTGFDIGIAATNAVAANIPIHTNIWYSTARTAYNTYVLGKYIETPNEDFEQIEVRDVDIGILNGSKATGRGNNFTPAPANQATQLFTDAAVDYASKFNDKNILQNILLSNFGGHYGPLAGQNANQFIDPAGLLRCRESQRLVGGDYAGLNGNNDLPDTIITESQIDGIIRKFGDMIYENNGGALKLYDDRSYGIQKTANSEIDAIKNKFIYRLSRAIKIVRQTLFEMPIMDKYSTIKDPENFLTPMERMSLDQTGKALITTGQNGKLKLTGSGTSGNAYATRLWNDTANTAQVNYVANPDETTFKDKQTKSVGQPLTLAFTTEFRLAFKEMVNKMIVARHDGSSWDASKSDAKFYNDDAFVAKCGGESCQHLITPDVSPILNMRIRKSGGKDEVILNYYDFLRDCLDSEYNLVQINFPNKELEQRRCTGGLLQISLKNDETTITQFEKYIKLVLNSKRTIINEIENVEKTAEAEWDAIKRKYEEGVQDKIDGYTAIIEDGYKTENDIKIENGIKRVRGEYNVAIGKFTKQYGDLFKKVREIDRRIARISGDVNKILERASGESISQLEREMNRLQDIKDDLISNFYKEYIAIRPSFVIPLDSLVELKDKIDNDQLGTGFTQFWKKKVSGDIESNLRAMISIGDKRIPEFEKEFKKASELEKYSDIQKNISEIQNYIRSKLIYARPNETVPLNKQNYGIWVIYKTGDFKFTTKYGLFNILNGSRIEDITGGITNKLIGTTGLKGTIQKYIDNGFFRGVIMFGKDGSTDWYLAPAPSFKYSTDISPLYKYELDSYRSNLFENFGKDAKMAMINDDDTNKFKTIIQNISNYDLTVVNQPLCDPTNTTVCSRLITDTMAKDILKNSIHNIDDDLERSFKKLLSKITNPEKKIMGGNKKKKFVVKKSPRSTKKPAKKSPKKYAF